MSEETRIKPLHGPTLSKLGADLRWFLEQNGLKPEECIVSIGVKSTIDQSYVIAGFLEGFDPKVMKRWDDKPNLVVLHGVPVWCIADGRSKKEAA